MPPQEFVVPLRKDAGGKPIAGAWDEAVEVKLPKVRPPRFRVVPIAK